MRYFFSGVEPRYQFLFRPDMRAGVMLNARYAHRPAVRDMCFYYQQLGIPMVMDSGVVQGRRSEDAWIEDYILGVGEYLHLCTWFAPFDEIGDFARTHEMYYRLLRWIPSRYEERIMYVFQSDPTKDLTDQQCQVLHSVLARHPYIGIGGLAKYCRRGQFDLIERYLDAIWAVTGGQCRRFHLFGVGNYRLLHRYRSKFGSGDSTTWLIGAHNELLQEQGGRSKASDPSLRKERALQANVETMLEWSRDEVTQLALFPS